MAQTIVFNLRQRLFGSKRETPPPAIERETIEKACKQLQRLINRCPVPAADTKRPLPYLPDVLSDLSAALREILFNYRERLHVLTSIEYLRIFLDHLLKQCTRMMVWMKQAGLTLNDQQSESGQSFTRYSLYFSHNLAELKALFVGGIYRGGDFRLTKNEAHDFWQGHFQSRTIVPWEEFRETLHLVHPIESPAESFALQTTIDLTNNQHVSIFEFDVFTRLFQPWSTLLNNWKLLAVTHPAYMAFMTHDKAKMLLIDLLDRPGSYLFRLSCTRLGQWALGYVKEDRTIEQTIVETRPFIELLIDGQDKGYLRYPLGKDLPVDLSAALTARETTRICVTEEQYSTYGAMDTIFELCKICEVNNKDSRIEPCGHFICRSCLTSWQKQKNGQSLALCPFCRCEIKCFESVIIEPFQRSTPHNISTIECGPEPSAPVDQDHVNSDVHQGSPPPPVPPRRSTMHSNADRPPPMRPESLPVVFDDEIESIDDIRSRLSAERGLNEMQIDALLTLTDGLLLSRQYALIKSFVDQLEEEGECF